MENIIQSLVSNVSSLGPFILLLGILIFVHELGHFSVAKWYGVRVEVFSLGFGRKLLQKKVGDTVYCISMIPLGGYVKMFGDDPKAEIPESEKRHSFLHQPLWPRTAVVLAGPLMNAIFAFFIFTVLSAIGEDSFKAQLGDVREETKAYQAGFRSHDQILKVNGAEILKWEQVTQVVEESGSKEVVFDVLRKGTGETLQVKATPEFVLNKNILSTKKEVGSIEGMTNERRAPVLGVVEDSIAAKAGLKTGDLVTKINGEEVEIWDDFAEKLKASMTGPMTKVSLDIVRYPSSLKGKPEELSLDVSFEKGSDLGVEMADLYLSDVAEGTAAFEAGLKGGDRLVKINGVTLTSWESVKSIVQGFQEGTQPLKVEYRRGGQTLEADILPRMTAHTDATGMEQKNFALGVMTSYRNASFPTVFIRETNPIKIVTAGFNNTVKWTYLTGLSFVRLFERKVSAKSIGGPIMIGKLANDTWEHGKRAFLRVMAIISINLFILNLLPIPILDGGHLLLFSIEFAKGSPLNFKATEMLQTAGFVLLMGLMLFAIFNDIMRVFA